MTDQVAGVVVHTDLRTVLVEALGARPDLAAVVAQAVAVGLVGDDLAVRFGYNELEQFASIPGARETVHAAGEQVLGRAARLLIVVVVT